MARKAAKVRITPTTKRQTMMCALLSSTADTRIAPSATVTRPSSTARMRRRIPIGLALARPAGSTGRFDGVEPRLHALQRGYDLLVAGAAELSGLLEIGRAHV